MRPTVDEQLAGIDRLLEQVGADPALGAESALLLRDARRQLGRLRGSLDRRLPFLRWDNAASAAVLQGVAPHLPAELAAKVTASVTASVTISDGDDSDGSDGDRDGGDERRAAERNDALRALLGQAIDALAEVSPQTDDTMAAKRLIVDHLRARANANPALHKNPTLPEPPRA